MSLDVGVVKVAYGRRFSSNEEREHAYRRPGRATRREGRGSDELFVGKDGTDTSCDGGRGEGSKGLGFGSEVDIEDW